MDSALLSDVAGYLRGRMERSHIPAVAFAVVRDGEIVEARGLGTANLEWEAPATADTAFQLASATKPLTGTLLMLLAERGDLRLEVPVREYLPQAPATWDTITVRHLATHTSGISDEVVRHTQTHTTAQAEAEGLPTTVEAVLEAAMEHPLEYEPGARAQYALADFVVLTAVLEAVTGTPFQRLLREQLFEPLGMSSTRYDNVVDYGPSRITDVVPRRAALYRQQADGLRDFRFFYPIWSYAAGGLLSSASDLARWLRALERGELLQPSTLDAMWATPVLTNGESGRFSLGWVAYTHRGRRVRGHSGGPALADIMHFPDEKLSVVVLCNQQSAMPDLAPAVADLLHTRMTYQAARVALRGGATPANGYGRPLDAYPGAYENPTRDAITVQARDDRLTLIYRGEATSLRPHDRDILVWEREEGDIPVYFTTGLSEAVDGLVVALESDGPPEEFHRAPDAFMLDRTVLERYAGEYELMGTTFTVAVDEDGVLIVTVPGQPEMGLEPLSIGTFAVKGGTGTTVEFKTDDAGVVTAAVLKESMGEVVAPRKAP